jgi:uncharacterized protein (DUF885 family)
MFRRCVSFVILLGLILANRTSLRAADNSTLDARRAQLNQLLKDEWEYHLKEEPESATVFGDYRYNDRWSDGSLAHVQQQKRDAQEWLSKFEALDTSGFTEQEKLSQGLIVRNLNQRLEGIELKTYEMPLDQFNGAHLQVAQFIAIIPFNTTKQYEDYLSRLEHIPALFDQLIEVLRQGEKDHLMPPRFLLEKTVTQCKSIADPAGEANPFGHPVAKFPDSVPEADRKRLHDAIIAAVDSEVRPAYRKLADFIATEYAPKGRAEPGVWSLPDGDARYRFSIRRLTTTNMDPEDIHQLGLKEVARIEAEELAIAKQLGFADLKSFRAAVRDNPKLLATSREQILDKYRGYIAQMQPELPKLFGLLPKTPLEVRPVQEFREKEAAAASYTTGTPDGSRPAIVYVNTGDYSHRSFITIETTAYHEGVPGHHMQIAIAQALPELPAFRQHGFFSAYSEGWALYAERLGEDTGFFQDPYSRYGHLDAEMLRAVRLVVDTGVHYKHWTRQQMVDFFHEHSSADEPSVQAETDRYIAWPAQALGYKLGQLEILKLRERAQKELGSRYDIRAFHDEILDGGPLPLDVLDGRVTAWIESQKAGGANAGQE